MSNLIDTFVRGHLPVKSCRVVQIVAEDVVKNIFFDVEDGSIRDIMIENLGDSNVHVVFSTYPLLDIKEPFEAYALTTEEQIEEKDIAWVITPGKHIIIEYTDGTHFTVKCSAGETTSVQIMLTLYSV